MSNRRNSKLLAAKNSVKRFAKSRMLISEIGGAGNWGGVGLPQTINYELYSMMQMQISRRGAAWMMATPPGRNCTLCVGTVMSDEDKARIILVTPTKKVDAPTQP